MTRRFTRSARSPQKEGLSLRALRTLRATFVALALAAAPVFAHDLEKTQVSIALARDGSFVIDVANEASWLAERLSTIPGPFADRVVLWVDGREIRPTSVEYLPTDARSAKVGLHRLRGRLPLDAQTLRWYYGLVIDPYPLTIHRADGRIYVEEIGGDAWSRTIDVNGHVGRVLSASARIKPPSFGGPVRSAKREGGSDPARRIVDRLVPVAIVAVFLVPLVFRVVTRAG